MGEVRIAPFVTVIFKEPFFEGLEETLGDRSFKHLGDQGGDRRALGPGQGHVGKERVTFESFDDCDDSVMAANAQVIALGDIVGQHDS